MLVKSSPTRTPGEDPICFLASFSAVFILIIGLGGRGGNCKFNNVTL